MLAGLSLNVRLTRPRARFSAFVPRLEALEARDCPAAPTISSFIATLDGVNVVLSGTISDESPETAQVDFSGAASGTAYVNSQGAFSITVGLEAIDTVFAVALDEEELESSAASSTPTNNAPTIVGFEAFREFGSPGNIWTFRGRVIDESPSGNVILSGLISLGTQEVSVDAEGYFSWTYVLADQEEGTAVVNFTDSWGVAAQTAYCIVMP